MRLSPRQVVVALAVVAGFALAGYGAAQVVGFRATVAPDLAVEQRLMCPQCQGVRLDVCDRPICDDMRADIRHRLAAGEGQDSIVAGYEAIYGPAVLAAAGASDSSALVPWLFVLIGLVLLGSLAFGRGAPAVLVPAVDAVPAASPPASQLVDHELSAWRSGR
jgi:cytochrome c-type biogenesis protein CcmH/NrfF